MQNEFPNAKNVCYLNTAAEGMIPVSAMRAMEVAIRRKQTPQVLEEEDYFELPARCRSLIAQLLNCDTDEVALVGSTGFGVGTLALSLPLEKGDEVLLVEKDFPSNNFSWEPLRSRGIQIRYIPFSPDPLQTERLLNEIRPETRALSISGVHYFTGYRYDLQAISERCDSLGIFLIVDAVQMIGSVHIDLQNTKVDALAAAGYKWQISPNGTGFLYIRRELMHKLQPLFSRWLHNADAGSFAEIKMFDYHPASSASRFELGGEPLSLWAGYEKSLQLIKECRIPWIESHNQKLVLRAKSFFQEIGWKVHESTLPAPFLSVVPPDKYFPRDLVKQLAEREVFVAVRENCLRISPHLYNTDQDIDRFIHTLMKLI